MTWYRGSSPIAQIARALAIALVVGWTIVPALCGGLFEVPHVHTDLLADNHGDVDADHDVHHNKLVSCCRSLADAKFLTAVPAEVQPAKMILIALVDTIGKANDVLASAAEPIAAATGPPLARSTRLLSYNPLAPPTRSA